MFELRLLLGRNSIVLSYEKRNIHDTHTPVISLSYILSVSNAGPFCHLSSFQILLPLPIFTATTLVQVTTITLLICCVSFLTDLPASTYASSSPLSPLRDSNQVTFSELPAVKAGTV